jgi:hypothetical protein
MIVSRPRAVIINAASPRLSTRLKFWRGDVYRTIFSVYRAMPDSTAKRGDVNFLGVRWIGHNAMTPFKVEAGYSAPVFAKVA